MKKAVIALGTNIGDKADNLKSAVNSIALLPNTKILRQSSIYETAPVGYAQQDNFFNACILIETTLSPNALLGACLGIEAGFKRIRTIKNGPRILDLDLIFYEGVTLDTPELTLPHPRFSERGFVLVPLNDLSLDDKICPYNLPDLISKTDISDIKKTMV